MKRCISNNINHTKGITILRFSSTLTSKSSVSDNQHSFYADILIPKRFSNWIKMNKQKDKWFFKKKRHKENFAFLTYGIYCCLTCESRSKLDKVLHSLNDEELIISIIPKIIDPTYTLISILLPEF